MNSFTGLLGPPRLSYFQIPVETFTDPFDCRGRPIVTRKAAFVKGRDEKPPLYYSRVCVRCVRAGCVRAPARIEDRRAVDHGSGVARTVFLHCFFCVEAAKKATQICRVRFWRELFSSEKAPFYGLFSFFSKIIKFFLKNLLTKHAGGCIMCPD